MPEPSESGERKAVGIYDRPASADRPWLKAVVFIVIVAIAAVVGYVMLRH
jgi:hypothetical protein